MDRFSDLLVGRGVVKLNNDALLQDILTSRTVAALRQLDDRRNDLLLDFIQKPGIRLYLRESDL
jgi:hypothetical protein